MNICEARMRVAGWSPVRSYFGNCLSAPSACSGRQMRNGFFFLNLIAWALIFAGFELLT
jgi:hypothetical protein